MNAAEMRAAQLADTHRLAFVPEPRTFTEAEIRHALMRLAQRPGRHAPPTREMAERWLRRRIREARKREARREAEHQAELARLART